MNAAAMSLFRTLGDMGYVVGPIALGFIADTAGTTSAFMLSAALLVVIGLIFGLYAPETRRSESNNTA